MSAPTILVTSLGLMGGSLAAALVRAGWEVLLHHRRPEVAARAEALGYGRRIDDPQAAVRACAVAVVCTPVEVIAEGVRTLAGAGGDAVITDVGSVKGTLCDQLADLSRAGRFVGSHPMAGSHLQGLEHARADLYRDRLTVLTPVAGTPPAAIAAIEGMWRAAGSRTRCLDPHRHDQAVVAASHLPHILASAAAASLAADAAPLAASGFRDTTRVAAGSPDLWRGILMANRDAVLAGLDHTSRHLDALAAALRAGDEAAVRAWLEAGRAGRQRYADQTDAGGSLQDGQ